MSTIAKTILVILGMTTAALAGFSSAARAKDAESGCAPSIRVLGQTEVRDYDSLGGINYLEPIRLVLENGGDGDCSGVVRIDALDPSPTLKGPGQEVLQYRIVDADDLGRVLFDPASRRGEGLPFRIGARGAVELKPRLLIPAGQAGHHGHYAATLLARIEMPREPKAEAQFDVSARILPRVQANLAGSRNATLDLGELTPALTRSINLQVRATGDVSVEITSENHGSLVHDRQSATIPYTMTLGGESVNLLSPTAMSLGNDYGLKAYGVPISVTVAKFINAPVGDYRDLVTITISAR